MNEIFVVSICIDENDNDYSYYYFSTFEKAFEFAKPYAFEFIQKYYEWENIGDELIEDLRFYGNLADLIYIEKVELDTGKCR